MFFIISLLLSLSLSLLFLMTSFPCPVWLSVRKEVVFKINVRLEFLNLKCSLGSLRQIWTSWPKLDLAVIWGYLLPHKAGIFFWIPYKMHKDSNLWETKLLVHHLAALMQYFSNIINDLNWVSNLFYVLNIFNIQMSWLMMVCVQ